MFADLHPLFFLLLLVVVAWFFRSLYLYVTDLRHDRRDFFSSVFPDEEKKLNRNNNNKKSNHRNYMNIQEGLDTVPTFQNDLYATVADARALYQIRMNLFFDFVGMNLVDVDFDGINNRYEITVVNRAGKQFVYYTHYNNIPAIQSGFFLQDGLSNLGRSYAPFMYTTDWQLAVTNIQNVLVPYTSTSGIKYTFMLTWNYTSNNVNHDLLASYLFSSNSSMSKAVESIAINVSAGDVSASATAVGSTARISASSGLPFLYDRPSLVLSAALTNWATVFHTDNTTKHITHYYHLDPTDPQKEKVIYPDLTYITPFVYFNTANGDLVVLNGTFYLKNPTTNEFTATSKDSWPTYSTDIRLENTRVIGDSFGGVIKTSKAKRYRRPTNQTNMYLTDSRSGSVLNYDEMIENTETMKRISSDEVLPFNIARTYPSTTEYSIGIANSELDRRLIYHLVSGVISIILIVVRTSSNKLTVEKVVVFENGQNKSADLVNDTIIMTEAEYTKYQNPDAIAPGSKTSPSAKTSPSSADIDETSNNLNAEITGISSSSGGGADSTGLSALEKKAMYDMVASLIFSRDAYSTATGYTTKNCPGCVVQKPKTSTEAKPKEKEKQKDSDNKDKDKEREREREKKSKSLPSYESQSATSLFAAHQQNLRERAKAKEEDKKEEKQKEDKKAKELSDAKKRAAKQEKQLEEDKKKKNDQSTSSKPAAASSSSLPMPANAPIPQHLRQPPTSMLVDSYLRRPPNPNYKPPMPVALDFSKIGWQT